MLRSLLYVFTLTFVSWSAAAQSVCVTLSSDGTAIVGNPSPLSPKGDCNPPFYPAGLTLLATSDPIYAAWMAVSGPGGTISNVISATNAVNNLEAAGITITGCTTYTAFNSYTFAVTPNQLAYLDTLRGRYKTNGMTFPTATQVPNISDTSGGPHPIVSLAEFTALDNIFLGYYNALQTYLAKINSTPPPTLPPTTSSTYGSC